MSKRNSIPREAVALKRALAPLGFAPVYSGRAPLIWRGLRELYGEAVFVGPLGWSERDTYDQLLDRPVMAPRGNRFAG